MIKIKKVGGIVLQIENTKIGDVLPIKIQKVGGCFIDRKYEKRETFLG